MNTDPEEAAELLASPGWSSPNDLDGRLQRLPGAVEAVAGMCQGWAAKLEEAPGVTPEYGDALREAAAALYAAADQLGSVIGIGLMGDRTAPASPRYREANVPFVPAAVPLPGQVRLRRPGSAPPPKLPWGERLDAQNQVHPRAKRAYRRARRAQRRAQ